MRVNGFNLHPGSFQITIENGPQQASRVVRNCRNYGDAILTLERLMDDPRGELKDALKFKVLDHEGNLERYRDFNSLVSLRGEELGMREIAWSLGHNKLVHFSAVSEAFVLLATAIARTIYHAFWLAVYLFLFCFVIGIPLLFLSLAWSWITQLMHR